MQRKIAEPDYDYTLETFRKENVINKIFFGRDILILKCTDGSARTQINTEGHLFEKETDFLLLDGIMFRIVECSEDFAMTVLRFSPNFFNVIYPIIDSNFFNVIEHSAPDLYGRENMKMTNLLFMQLCLLHQNKDHSFREKLAINITTSYIYEIYEQTYPYADNKAVLTNNSKDFLLDKFFNLCDKYHTTHRNIEFYADKLSISSRYLYKLCKERLQMTPKESIDYLIMGTAKRLLLTTDLTNQQIADKLNFPDQSTFGQYFKRNVGMPPSEFRKKYK